MIDLFTGIYTHFSSVSASSFRSDVGGQFFLEEAPSSAVMPYGVYGLVTGTREWTFTSNYEKPLMDFNVFSDSAGGAVEITTIYKHMKAAFDDANFTIANNTHLRMRRTAVRLARDSEIVPNKSIWHLNVEYEMLMRSDS